jgi:arylsulfatase A-like enzyme
MPYSKKKISVDAYVQTIDIFPTLLDILDITSENILMGNSIFSIKDKPNRIIFSEHLRLKWVNPQRSLIVGKHKLIRDLRNNKHLLYNMEEDELEKVNILKINPESKSFINQMNLFLKEINTHYQNIKGSITDLDKKTYDQLKSLGYIN